MTREDDFIGQLEGYLEEYEGMTPLPDAVHDAVRAELPTTKQIGPKGGLMRLPNVNRFIVPGLAAAAVVIAAFVGIQALLGSDVGGPGPFESPSPTPTATPYLPTNAYGAMDEVRNGALDPGTYTAYQIGGSIANALFTVPAGWTWNGSHLSKGGVDPPEGAAIFFFRGNNVQVYADPCQWAGAEPASPIGSSVHGLVDALAAQPMRSATTPAIRQASVPNFGGPPGSIIPNRLAGLAVELTVPDDIVFADCSGGEFRSWGPDANARSHQGPGQRDLVWVVDTQRNGVEARDEESIIIDASSFPGTPSDVMAEIESILDSIALGHWG